MLTTFFQGVLQLSIQGSLFLVFVLIFRKLLRCLGAPKLINHLLWCALLFQLLCPWRIPLSSFTQYYPTLENKLSTLSTLSQETSAQITANLSPLRNNTMQNTTNELSNAAQPPLTPPLQSKQNDETTSSQSIKTAATALWQFLSARYHIFSIFFSWLWLSIALVFLLRGFAQYDYLRRHLRLAYRVHVHQKTYYTGTGVSTPFILGVLKPRIYLPSNLECTERNYIYRHEQAHLAHGDFILKPLFYLALCLHWFNPFVWFAMRKMAKDIESACDETVLTCFTTNIKASYCNSLLRFSHAPRYATMTLCFGEGDFTNRIRDILNYKKPSFWAIISGILLVSSLCLLCLFNPLKTNEPFDFLPTETTTPSATSTLPEESTALQESATPAPQASASATPAATELPIATSAQATPEIEREPEFTTVPETEEATAENAIIENVMTSAILSLIWPVPDYYYISRWTEAGTHNGIDIVADKGTAVYAAADGVVTAAGYNAGGTGYGYAVVIEHGNGWQTFYAHADSIEVEVGDIVTQGDWILSVGSTGYSSGNHLHFELLLNDVSIAITEENSIFAIETS